MRLAMIFTQNRLVIFYATRVVNWLCTMAVLWWGICMLPKGKWIFLFLTLLPMNLQQMISVSADGMATAIVFALIAFVIRAMMEKHKFIWRDYMTIGLLSVGLVCWKVFYAPMVILLLLIPGECFASVRKKQAAKAGCIFGTFLLVLGWALICYLNMFHGASDGIEGSTSSMISYLLAHPLDYFVRLGKDLITYIPNYVAGIFGPKLSWGNIIPGNVFWLSSFVLCIAMFAASRTPELSWKARSTMIGMSVVCVLLVYLLLYVWWTPMDSPRIQGFQGRYLLPLTLPVMIAVKPPKWNQEKLLPYLIGIAVLIDIGVLIRIVQHVAI